MATNESCPTAVDYCVQHNEVVDLIVLLLEMVLCLEYDILGGLLNAVDED